MKYRLVLNEHQSMDNLRHVFIEAAQSMIGRSQLQTEGFLSLQRLMTKQERDRVRQRGIEAETRRKGRTAQVLDKAPKGGGGEQ